MSSFLSANLNNDTTVRLYRDNRPHCLEVAQLHKGLVLMSKGKELIEEGVGFGTPIVLYRDKTYFACSAEVFAEADSNREVLVKNFFLDSISRKKVGGSSYVDDGFYSFAHGIFHKVYVNRKTLTPFFNKIIELRKIFGMKTDFVKAEPKGVITVRYVCLTDSIHVEVSLLKLDKAGCQEILIMNEQGATHFRKYSDSDGTTLTDSKIGAWETVEADEASFTDPENRLSFSLKRLDGAKLYRGRELTPGRFSWAGLGYSLRPQFSHFKYAIKLSKS